MNLDVCSYIPERGCAKFLNLTHPLRECKNRHKVKRAKVTVPETVHNRKPRYPIITKRFACYDTPSFLFAGFVRIKTKNRKIQDKQGQSPRSTPKKGVSGAGIGNQAETEKQTDTPTPTPTPTPYFPPISYSSTPYSYSSPTPTSLLLLLLLLLLPIVEHKRLQYGAPIILFYQKK